MYTITMFGNEVEIIVNEELDIHPNSLMMHAMIKLDTVEL